MGVLDGCAIWSVFVGFEKYSELLVKFVDGEGEGEKIFAVFPFVVFFGETFCTRAKAGFDGGFFVFEKDGFVSSAF